MTKTLMALLCLLLLAACGGGGTSEVQRPLTPMTTDEVGGLSSTYHAEFDVSAQATVNGLSVTATGTLSIRALADTATSPFNSLVGRLVRYQIFLSAVGQSFDIEIREFVYVDGEGRWWSLGGEDTEGNLLWWDNNDTIYPAPVDLTVNGRMLNLDATMAVGQVIHTPAKDGIRGDDLTTVVLTRTSTRNTVAIDEADTPLARFQCYRSNNTEIIDVHDGNGPIAVDFIRWERPEMGLVALRASNIHVVYDSYDVTLQQMDCVITSHTP